MSLKVASFKSQQEEASDFVTLVTESWSKEKVLSSVPLLRSEESLTILTVYAMPLSSKDINNDELKKLSNMSASMQVLDFREHMVPTLRWLLLFVIHLEVVGKNSIILIEDHRMDSLELALLSIIPSFHVFTKGTTTLVTRTESRKSESKLSDHKLQKLQTRGFAKGGKTHERNNSEQTSRSHSDKTEGSSGKDTPVLQEPEDSDDSDEAGED